MRLRRTESTEGRDALGSPRFSLVYRPQTRLAPYARAQLLELEAPCSERIGRWHRRGRGMTKIGDDYSVCSVVA